MSDASKEYLKALEGLREGIDAVDQQVVDLLAKRQKQVDRVVELKKEHNLQVYHPAREENLISARRERGLIISGLYEIHCS